MSTDTPNPAPGWYPDPSGSGTQRWWNGATWTEYARPLGAVPPAPPAYGEYAQQQHPAPSGYDNAPAYASPGYATYGAIPGVPAGTPVYTWFIWVIVLLPLASAIALALFDLSGYMTSATTSATAQLQLMTSPGYLALVAVGWISYFGTVALAFGDQRGLRRLGYQGPFHWAWAFLPWGTLVYVIGRSVVVKRRSGRGLSPIWVLIAVYVVTLVVGVIKVSAAISAVMTSLSTSGLSS
jgi:Uncharacterized protein conserved in bacteria